jgi:hypothetical protein
MFFQSQINKRLERTQDALNINAKALQIVKPTFGETLAKYIAIGVALYLVTSFFATSNQSIGATKAKAEMRQMLATQLETPIENINIQSTLTPKPTCDLKNVETCKIKENLNF